MAVKEEVTIVDFKVVPESVLASAVTVIGAEPSKSTPLIALAVASLVAVPALPVIEPVIALVTVISVAQSFKSLLVVSPTVWGVVWSVNTAPVREVRNPVMA
jgi:hypothetical protein